MYIIQDPAGNLFKVIISIDPEGNEVVTIEVS